MASLAVWLSAQAFVLRLPNWQKLKEDDAQVERCGLHQAFFFVYQHVVANINNGQFGISWLLIERRLLHKNSHTKAVRPRYRYEIVMVILHIFHRSFKQLHVREYTNN